MSATVGRTGALPEGITGTWRYYAKPGGTRFLPVTDGWTVTLTDGSITFDLRSRGQVERPYEVLRQDGRRYSLEMRDDRSATSTVHFELAACGAFVESEGVCDAFCENAARELGLPTAEQMPAGARDAARNIGGARDPESLEQIDAMARESLADGLYPVFPERVFFVRQGGP
ncbi:MAG TPA: hypothetical protein VF322_07775 [Gammaproteobacteria bacterium]